VERQVEDYLFLKSVDITSLTAFQNFELAFQNTNSTLPSNAPVAGLILVPRWCKMMDNLFDKMRFEDVGANI
jgi:hypothetical protein